MILSSQGYMGSSRFGYSICTVLNPAIVETNNDPDLELHWAFMLRDYQE